jgi:hypothetical protein
MPAILAGVPVRAAATLSYTSSSLHPMPSPRHEAAAQMLHDAPSVILTLLSAGLGVSLPAHDDLRVESANLPDLIPTEYRANAVVTLRLTDLPVLSVVVEVQLRHDPAKNWVWPVYLANLRARQRCPVLLLVLCLTERTARACARPIDLGHPGWVLTPLVAGPTHIPTVTDPSQARLEPAMAVLSALAHPDREDVLSALPQAFLPLGTNDFDQYYRLVEAALPSAARRYLEDLVATTYQYKSEFARKHVNQGRAEGRVEGQVEGRAEAVIEILDARRVKMSDDDRTRITACQDIEQLTTWIRRAATADSVDDLFG